jgi:adenylosuccinate lyase
MNPNVLSQRYATKEMNMIFSDEGKIRYERELWISVLKAQKELGMDISQDAILAYDQAKDYIDLNLIKEIELRTKHDVKAKIEAFNQATGGIEYLHMGMTSRDLTDNVEQIQIKKACTLVHSKYVSVLRHFLDKAEEYKHIEITGRTHHQAAQITLLGRRFSMWAEELLHHLLEFQKFMESYPLRGIKGVLGTQMDMINLLGSKEKAEELERIVTNHLGFKSLFVSTGQVYPRSLDYKLISHLATLASACENFAKTMRLMAGYELVTEGFLQGQVGSSVMPHKMNTRSTERICAFSHLIKMYSDGASRLMGDQWEEGDVSCSAIRRVLIPDAFYATDGLIETTLNVLNNMGAYPAVINKELDRYLPFLATTQILGLALKYGIGREKAHSIIKKYAIAEALRMREEGTSENNLLHLLANDPVFKDAGIKKTELNNLFSDRMPFLGNAIRQIDLVKKKSKSILKKYAKDAAYEPGAIL